MYEPHALINPGYGKLHIGIYISAIKDALDRFNKLPKNTNPLLEMTKTEMMIEEIGMTGMPNEVIRKGKGMIRAREKIGGMVEDGRGAVAITVHVE